MLFLGRAGVRPQGVRTYRAISINAYWIIDADAHAVEVWTPDAALPQVEREGVAWQPAAAVPPFVLSLAELFQPV